MAQNLNQQSFVPYTNPVTGEQGDALFISKDDPRLTPEFLQQFSVVMAIDDNAKPIKDSEEIVATWTDDLRRKQAYRGQGYATEIVEISAGEALQKAKKAAKEMEEREKAEKEEHEAREKAEKEETERRKRRKKDAEKEEGRKRKQARKEAAERRRNFQVDIKPDYDFDISVTGDGGDE